MHHHLINGLPDMIQKLSTKERILESSLILFNSKGIKNVRLQHIADETGISVGNLAYHFPDMKHILNTLQREIVRDLNTKMKGWVKSTFLIDFDNRLIQNYHLMNKYAFYFIDAIEIERTYPRIHQKRLEYVQRLIDDYRKWLEFMRDQDFLKFEEPAKLESLAEMIWFITNFWLLKCKILDKPTSHEMAFREAVWNQLSQYFREKARNEFEIIIQPKLSYF